MVGLRYPHLVYLPRKMCAPSLMLGGGVVGSVYNTLAHRAKVISSTPEDLTKELDHLKKTLMACQFPNWALDRLQQQFQLKHNHNSINNQT